jgi:hypothetical protein
LFIALGIKFIALYIFSLFFFANLSIRFLVFIQSWLESAISSIFLFYTDFLLSKDRIGHATLQKHDRLCNIWEGFSHFGGRGKGGGFKAESMLRVLNIQAKNCRNSSRKNAKFC